MMNRSWCTHLSLSWAIKRFQSAEITRKKKPSFYFAQLDGIQTTKGKLTQKSKRFSTRNPSSPSYEAEVRASKLFGNRGRSAKKMKKKLNSFFGILSKVKPENSVSDGPTFAIIKHAVSLTTSSDDVYCYFTPTSFAFYPSLLIGFMYGSMAKYLHFYSPFIGKAPVQFLQIIRSKVNLGGTEAT